MEQNKDEIKKTAKEFSKSRYDDQRVAVESLIAGGADAKEILEAMIESESSTTQAWAIYGLLTVNGLDPARPSKRISGLANEGTMPLFKKWAITVLATLAAIGAFVFLLYFAWTAAYDRDLFASMVLVTAIVTVLLVLASGIINVIQRIVARRREERRSEEFLEIRRAADILKDSIKDSPEPALIVRIDDKQVQETLLRYSDRPDLVELAVQAYPEPVQRAIADFLVESGARVSIETSVAGRTSKNRRVLDIFLLGWFEKSQSLPLLAQLTGAGDIGIVLAAANALSKYNNRYAYEVLRQMLKDERLPRSRTAELLRHSSYDDKPALDIKGVADENQKIRFWTAYLLGRSGDSQALSALHRLCEDESAEVAASAVESLGRLKDKAAIPIVQRLLSHPSWLVRVHAAKAAKMLGNSDLISYLTPLLRDDQWWVRQNAAIALEGMGRPAVPELIKNLSNGDRFARNKSAEILGRLGVVAEQIDKLSGDAASRKSAHKVLVAIGKAEAGAAIENKLLQADPELQCRLSQVLADIGHQSATSFLKRVHDKTESDKVKVATEDALDKIRGAA